jgi:hypothetical protein
MEERPNYYAIIPANIRYDADLTANAKLLYGEITALCNEKGYCWATNEYFANLYGVSKTSISKWISSLIQKEYIFSETIYKEGTKEILNRYLRIVKDPIEEKLNRGIEEKLKDNNTNINNTINNKEIYKERFKKPTLEEVKEYCEERNNGIDAEMFINFYESKGWMVGKNKMKDWKACVRTWEKKSKHIIAKEEKPIPDWFDKELETQEITKLEEEEMESILESFGGQ